MLRSLDWVTVSLAFLWALSPLSSQAMQRMSITGDPSTRNVTVNYVDTWTRNVAFNGTDTNTTQGVSAFLESVDALFASSFLPAGQDQKTPQDQYSYPRIPVIENMDLYGAKNLTEWIDTSWAKTDPSYYSSFYGIPMQDFYENFGADAYSFTGVDHFSLTIQSSYLYFNCSDLIVKTLSEVFAMIDAGALSGSSSSQTVVMGIHPTLNKDGTDGTAIGTLDFASAIDPKATHSVESATYSYSKCNFEQRFYDSQLGCEGNLCNVTAMRPTPSPPPRSSMNDFSSDFVTATSMDSTVNITTMAEQYLYDPSTVTMINYGNSFNLSSGPTTKDFTQRLSLLINTYWQLGFAPMYQTGGFYPNNSDNVVSQSAVAQYTSPPRYWTDWRWFSIFMICSVLLLVFGVVGVIWESLTISPDILGFASSLAKPSKYMQLPDDLDLDETIGGAERARRLGNLRVMMMDVNAKGKVGKIALGTPSENAQRLQKGRLYR